MKYFIGADIEAPHLSYYEIIGNDPHFFGRWAWAAEDGMPDDGAVYFDMCEDAQEMVDDLKKPELVSLTTLTLFKLWS